MWWTQRILKVNLSFIFNYFRMKNRNYSNVLILTFYCYDDQITVAQINILFLPVLSSFHTFDRNSCSWRKRNFGFTKWETTNSELIWSRIWLDKITDDYAAVPLIQVGVQQSHSSVEPRLNIFAGVEYHVWITTFLFIWFTLVPNHIFGFKTKISSEGTWNHNTESSLCWYFCFTESDAESHSTVGSPQIRFICLKQRRRQKQG